MNRKSISDVSGLQNMSRNVPIAESTHISADEASLVKSSPVSSSSKFQWGGKMTPKRKATSPLLNNKSIFKSNLSVQRIDPQTYLDTQSKGLVSRIVKYHDISQRAENKKLPKSIYNKPGQFPVVNLRKNEIIYSPKRNQNITRSTVRIPPPDSSIYDVASRSSILRTGSITNLSQLNENEPLTHSEDDKTVPTRSVLDALKEISRKRINSEDLEIERHKKQCTETTDVFDGPSRINSGILAKRQRDIPVCTVISTEQQKKRMCSKNNDILSSLSSSLHMTTPKRKVSDMTIQPEGRQVNVQQKAPESQSPPHKKQIRSDLNVEKTIQLTSSEELPESPLKISTQPIPIQLKQTVPKLTLFNRNYTTVETRSSNLDDEEDEEKISFVKPKKSSSFSNGKNEVLKQMDNRKLALMLSCLKGDYEETDDEVDAVPEKKKEEEVPKVLELPKISVPIEIPKEVPPKTVTSTIPATSIVPPATTTTTNLINFETPQKPAGFTLPTATTVQSTTAAVVTNTTPSLSLPVKAPATTIPIAIKPVQTPSFGIPEVKTTSVPSGGFAFGATNEKTTTASTVPSFAFGAQNKPATGATTTTHSTGFTIAKPVTAVQPQKPVGGFSFGQNATTTAPPAFGLGTVPATTTPSFGQSSVPATTTPSFGQSSVPTTTPAFGLGSVPATTFSQKSGPPTTTPSFGQNSGPTTTAAPTFGLGTVSATTTPSFGQNSVLATTTPSFGQKSSPATTTPSFGLNSATTATPSFGQTTVPTPVFGQNSVPTPSFGQNNGSTPSFGQNSTPAFGQTAPTPSFGFNSPNTTPKTTPSDNKVGFSFGGSKPAVAPQKTPATSAFSFGQDSTPKTFGAETTTTSSAGMFGKTAPPSFGQTNQPIVPSFGQTAPATGMFGQAAPPPAFGQNTPTATALSFGNVSNTSSPAFSFAGNKAAPETNSFKFGGTQTASQPSFGSPALATTTSSFSFSTNSTATNTFGSNNGTAAPSFGGIVTNTQSTPSFGNPAPNVNVFGGSSFTSAQTSAPAQSASFGFGGAQNLTTNNTASPFAFASNTAKPAATNSTPSFGGVANNTNSAFSFGNNAPAPEVNKAPGAFNFGSSAPQPATGFGNTSFGAPQTAPPPAYGSPQQQPQAPGNLFAVGPGNTGTPQRRIRTATRRMK